MDNPFLSTALSSSAPQHHFRAHAPQVSIRQRLVLGIVVGVITAVVFAVVPVSQDRSARDALDSVKLAEFVQYSQSTGDGLGVFLAGDRLAGSTNAARKVLLHGSPRVSVNVSRDGQHFIGGSASETGTVFYVTETDQPPVTIAPTSAGDVTAPVWNPVAMTWSSPAR